MATLDRETLEAALIGYEQQKDAIDIKIKVDPVVKTIFRPQ